jgi:hypothetical protein
MKYFVYSIVFLVLASFVNAQGFRSEGREFYICSFYQPLNDHNLWGTNIYANSIIVTSFLETDITIAYFDAASGKEDSIASFHILPKRTYQYPLDINRLRMPEGLEVAQYRSVHIKSKKPINVQYVSTGHGSGAGYLALPVSCWGKEYVVGSYEDNPGLGLKSHINPQENQTVGQFTVVASQPGTLVSITPSAKSRGGHPGVFQGGIDGLPHPYVVALEVGQCYQVQSVSGFENGTDDISGSIIRSNKPVAVIAGHQAAEVLYGDARGLDVNTSDMMIEQMVPFEYLDNTGYITIPFPEPVGGNPNAQGEHIRFFVLDSLTPSGIFCNSGSTFTPTHKYSGSTLFNRTTPQHFYSEEGKKFSVIQYDLKNYGTHAPLSSPSMSTVVPRSHWRNAYLCSTPSIGTSTNPYALAQTYFLTIIGPKDGILWDKIKVTEPGGVTSSLSTIGPVEKTYSSIPDFPDLKAVIYKVTSAKKSAYPETFYLNAPFTFTAYQLCDRGVAYSMDNFIVENTSCQAISNAMPAGMSLRNRAVPNALTYTVDTLCSGWRICVRDNNSGGGIKMMTLLEDPTSDLVAGSNGRLVYKNCSFTTQFEVNDRTEVVLPGKDSQYCFTVQVDDPSHNAFAPIEVMDNAGNSIIIELSFKSAAISITPSPVDSGLIFRYPRIGNTVCEKYVFRNNTNSPRAYNFSGAKIAKDGDSWFSLFSVEPPLPALIQPGDSLVMNICFTGKDTNTRSTSLELSSDCFTTSLPIRGTASTGIIEASDCDFAEVLVGTAKCKPVTITNIGHADLVLTKNWLIENTSSNEFSFDTITSPKLPFVLTPGTSVKMTICYAPVDGGNDEALLRWDSDVDLLYRNTVKGFSLLKGSGLKQGVVWDRRSHFFMADSTMLVTARMNLTNIFNVSSLSTTIRIEGVDKNEFEVLATELGSFGDFVIDPGDSIWVDVGFRVDMTKPLDQRYLDRKAQLVTEGKADLLNKQIVELTGGFTPLLVSTQKASRRIQVYPNPVTNSVLELLFNSDMNGTASIAVYSLLGERVYQIDGVSINEGENRTTLSFSDIAQGMYIVKVVFSNEQFLTIFNKIR